MFGAQTLDHVAFPVRDLPRSEKFYRETVGLTFLTQRKNADGSPRHTYVQAGENIVGLTLPGVSVAASKSGAPRYAIGLPTEAAFDAAVARVQASGVYCSEVEDHSSESPFVKAFQFIDPDDNRIELCVRRKPLAPKDGISHVIFETADLARAERFYTKALGLTLVGELRGETLFEFANGQMLGVKEVAELSDRTKKKDAPAMWHSTSARKITTSCSNEFPNWAAVPSVISAPATGCAHPASAAFIFSIPIQIICRLQHSAPKTGR